MTDIQLDAAQSRLPARTRRNSVAAGSGPYGGGTVLPWYTVSRDSRRILATTTPLSPATSPITLLLNWNP
jgi:hypothetical protein